MSSNAQTTVLSTPDLLVCILSQLPHSSLLKAKLVNKTWASIFEVVYIKAALFEQPRPKELDLYTETYSDILRNKFSTFWPSSEKEPDKANIPKSYFKKKFHTVESNEKSVGVSRTHNTSVMHLQKIRTLSGTHRGT
ncbi:hypothetical protein F5884DRAFT_750498 [Xylogone sp. PMI_703]|nr:hypothetical protein F5884DRAFT_750498 [Xylogone sp. PMI_703]